MGREGSECRRFARLLRRSGIRVLFASSGIEPGDASLCFGSVRWWCVSEMRQQRGVGVVCGLINGVVTVYAGKVGLGLVGYMQGLWLGRSGGERGPGG
jgi:hypothetical protein